MNDVADTPGANHVSDRQGIRLAAVLRTHLNYLLGLLDDIASFNSLGEHVGKRLLHVAILSRLHHLHA